MATEAPGALLPNHWYHCEDLCHCTTSPDRWPQLSNRSAYVVRGRTGRKQHLSYVLKKPPSFCSFLTFTVFISLSFGAVCVVLILSKYLVSRLGVLNSTHAGSATASGLASQPTLGVTSTVDGTVRTRRRMPKIDPFLVTRFAIAFVILL